MSALRPSHPPLAYAPPVPGSFQLADLVRLLLARRRLILSIAGGVVGLAVLACLLMPNVYSSAAEVMLEQQRNTVADASAVLSPLPTDPATLQNQIQILTSRDLAAQVVARLHLDRDPEFNPALAHRGIGALLGPFARPAAPAINRDRIVTRFLSHIFVDANGLSTTLTVGATAHDPAKAMAIANALAETYVDSQLAIRRAAGEGTSGWLERRTRDLARQLVHDEEAVQQYKALHGLNDSAPGNSLVDQQMAAINAQIVAARSDLAEKQAQLDRVGPSAAAGNAADVSQVVASPLIVQLRGQEADLIRQEADLSSKYGPMHPKLQALEAQKRDLDAKIAQEVTRIVGSLTNDVATAKTHLASLEQSLASVEHEADSQNMARVALQALQANADSTRAQYQVFVGRLRQTEDQDPAAAPDSRIISRAAMPLAPSAPKRGLILGASLPLGLLLGVLAALIAEKLGPLMPVRVNGAPRAAIVPPPAPWSGPPILAELANAETLGAASYVVDYPSSRYAHAMAALVSELDPRGAGAAVVAVTSAAPGESKSAIAVSLARAAAQMGKKAVILDCDPDQLAARALGAESGTGLFEVLTGKTPLAEALARDSLSAAHALTMTKKPPNLSTMFGSGAMARLVGVLKEGADLVVLNCAEAAAGPDAALLARLADATLLVARKDWLGNPLLSRSMAVLTGAHAAPVGIVATT